MILNDIKDDFQFINDRFIYAWNLDTIMRFQIEEDSLDLQQGKVFHGKKLLQIKSTYIKRSCHELRNILTRKIHGKV